MTHFQRRRTHRIHRRDGIGDLFSNGNPGATDTSTPPADQQPTQTPSGDNPKDTGTPNTGGNTTKTPGNGGNGNGNNGGNGNGNGNGNNGNSNSTTQKDNNNTTSSSSTTTTTSSSSSTTSSTTTTTTGSTSQTSKASQTLSNTDTKASNTLLTTPTQNTVRTTATISQSAPASSTTTVSDTGGVTTSTGTLVAAIGGAIVGVAILSFLIAFFIRRWRRRRDEAEAEAFSPSQFRRSAVILDDAYNPDDESPFAASPPMSARNGSGTPRPPTMIERHMAHASPAMPPASYSPTGYNYGQQQDFYQQDHQYASYNPGEIMHSPISPPPDQDPTSPSPFLNRQSSPTQQYVDNYPQHHNEAQYVDVDRASPTPRAVHGEKRPETLYDPDDAYGGM